VAGASDSTGRHFEDPYDVQISDDEYLRNKLWQASIYPLLERDFSGDTDWMTWSEYDIPLSADELNVLLTQLKTEDKDVDIFEMKSSNRQIEICPICMAAMSRRAEIVGLVHKGDSWILRFKFE
jgi:hypothetical protein